MSDAVDFSEVFVPEEGTGEEELFYVEGLDDDIPVEEVIEEEPEAVKLLREQNTVLAGQVTSLQGQADATAAMTKGIADLGQSLQRPQQPQVAQAVVDPTEAKKKFNDDFFNDPYENMMAFQREKLGPELTNILKTNAQYAKQFLLLDPEKSKVYNKYKDEVEEVFSKLAPAEQFQDPNAYKKAADVVASRHFSDTVDDMKAELRAEIMAELKGTGAVPVVGAVAHSESGVSGGGVRKPGSTNVLPREVWEHAGRRGLQGRGEKEDKARVYHSWKEGKLNVPGMTKQ